MRHIFEFIFFMTCAALVEFMFPPHSLLDGFTASLALYIAVSMAWDKTSTKAGDEA